MSTFVISEYVAEGILASAKKVKVWQACKHKDGSYTAVVCKEDSLSLHSVLIEPDGTSSCGCMWWSTGNGLCTHVLGFAMYIQDTFGEEGMLQRVVMKGKERDDRKRDRAKSTEDSGGSLQ